MKCEKCKGSGYVNTTYRHGGLPPYDTTTFSTALCDACHGSGVVSAPRTEGPRRIDILFLLGGGRCSIQEGHNSGRLLFAFQSAGSHVFMADTIDADGERQLYELLRLRAEQGPPREGT